MWVQSKLLSEEVEYLIFPRFSMHTKFNRAMSSFTFSEWANSVHDSQCSKLGWGYLLFFDMTWIIGGIKFTYSMNFVPFEWVATSVWEPRCLISKQKVFSSFSNAIPLNSTKFLCDLVATPSQKFFLKSYREHNSFGQLLSITVDWLFEPRLHQLQ